ncbi:hypothetical protein ACVWWD_005212 [Mesorhizobium sp. URHB0026]
MMHDLFGLLGIKGPVVAAGLAGGVLRALSRHRYSCEKWSRRQSAARLPPPI